MAAVAEGFVFAQAATAEADGGAAAEAKFFAFGIDHGEIAFDAKGTVIEYRYFSCHILLRMTDCGGAGSVELADDGYFFAQGGFKRDAGNRQYLAEGGLAHELLDGGRRIFGGDVEGALGSIAPSGQGAEVALLVGDFFAAGDEGGENFDAIGGGERGVTANESAPVVEAGAEGE